MSAYQHGLVFHNNAWKTPNQIVAETNTATPVVVPLTDQFPVSTGLQHMSSDLQAQGGMAEQPSVFPGQQVGPVGVALFQCTHPASTDTLVIGTAYLLSGLSLCMVRSSEWTEFHGV